MYTKRLRTLLNLLREFELDSTDGDTVRAAIEMQQRVARVCDQRVAAAAATLAAPYNPVLTPADAQAVRNQLTA